jgi:hypothetical protein
VNGDGTLADGTPAAGSSSSSSSTAGAVHDALGNVAFFRSAFRSALGKAAFCAPAFG